ncbi:hypothetical protein N2152v2_009908 [Parachlorella kessleri]
MVQDSTVAQNGTLSGKASTSNVGTALVGAKGFKRHNPRSDRFPIHKFHHFEFWTGEATMTAKRFTYGLGMPQVAKSDQSTGNHHFASYVLQSNDLVFAVTAPYGRQAPQLAASSSPCPWYSQDKAYETINAHGLYVRAVGLLVADAAEAYRISVEHGGEGVLEPTTLTDEVSGQQLVVSEIKAYGDCVLRFVSGSYEGPYLPGYETTPPAAGAPDFGLQRCDHAVFNTHNLLEAVQYLSRAVGFHEFAEFVADDVGTLDSGLNSMVLANNSEMVLMPVNEPTFGTKRKSQIQTYLEQNQGPGLQHLALKTDDIFRTMREMRARADCGGFDFMPWPEGDYYRQLPARIGKVLSEEQYKAVEELGLLVDADDQGVLLQVFTKPLGDRPTVFFEIIQRLCLASSEAPPPKRQRVQQEVGGCGGFGKGNFSALFKSIEVYETDLGIN